jgi:hypothetical protein
MFILQLQNYANERMLWFLECSTYFVVCGFSRTIRFVNAFIVVYEVWLFVSSL